MSPRTRESLVVLSVEGKRRYLYFQTCYCFLFFVVAAVVNVIAHNCFLQIRFSFILSVDHQRWQNIVVVYNNNNNNNMN